MYENSAEAKLWHVYCLIFAYRESLKILSGYEFGG